MSQSNAVKQEFFKEKRSFRLQYHRRVLQYSWSRKAETREKGGSWSQLHRTVPSITSSLPLFLALDQFHSHRPAPHWPGLVAEQPLRCYALAHEEPCGWWSATLLASAQTFPAMGFVGRTRSRCSMRGKARGGRTFQMKQSQSRRSCRDQHGKESTLLTISYTAPPPTTPENVVAKWQSRPEDWGWAVMPQLQQAHQMNTMLLSTVKRHRGGPGPSDFVHNLRWADWTLKGGL